MNNRFETTDGSTYHLLLEKAIEMRKQPTEAESVLWKHISGNRLGVHFRRQHPVYGYIPDFVCISHKLIIEIDGGYHFEGEQPEKDIERTNYLNNIGYTVLRFTNEEVLCNIEAVLKLISDNIVDHQSNHFPLSSGKVGNGFPSPREGLGVGIRKLRTIEMKRLTVEEFHEAEKLPLVVVLDDVRSMYNVGSVFRTSDAFRVEKICLCGITATPPHPEIHKTALGAEDSVNWQHYPSAFEAVEELKARGYVILSVEQAEGSTLLPSFQPDPDKKYAVVLGNEVKGVHQEVIDVSDACLEIPQLGTKHSMNVSVTAGIIIYQFALPHLQ